ncbi:hypothetical protein FRC14_006054 [Serendipita sp. 396]|nr:hypothetical protein FRC14_006054 [Serendipita sp. 396]KAG8788319.1 hypothetical protein FRC15_004902 [Serendipita sp. 397]KAG8837314.1 hypothetical protein FRC18_009482 [Serendipita sp. 400]KAG8858880.1 hypothetical protein FRB91_009124 [Serendipita sp. 411]KAG9050816.1 hypothetical protein FS842_011304 [Serendipita sp. 407]
MVGYSLVLSVALAATSVLASPLIPTPCASSTTAPTPTTSIPVGKRDPKGLDSLAKRKKRFVGCAYDVYHISDVDYTQLVLAQFGQLTPENSLKWESTEPTRNNFTLGNGDTLVKIAEKNKIWVTAGNFAKNELISVMKNHIVNVAGHFRGHIATWDVVNEVFNEDGTFRSTVFHDTIGPEFIDIAFRTAKLADPFATLAINDYNIDGLGPKSTAMVNLVKSARSRGVPIEQIGAQAHLVVGTLPTNIRENWQAFANTGAWVAITEIDIRMPTPPTEASLAQQKADYKTVVNACLAVSRCVGVTVWGATDKYSWVPDVFDGEGAACPYDENLKPKPAYYGMVEAFKA